MSRFYGEPINFGELMDCTPLQIFTDKTVQPRIT